LGLDFGKGGSMKLNSATVIGEPVSSLRGFECWFAVRRSGDDGSEFIIPSDWGADLEHAKHNAERDKKQIPQWDKTNPVVRFARVKLVAVEVE